MFEYLVEHRAIIPNLDVVQSADASLVGAMLQRRQEWIDNVAQLALRRHLPSIAVRTIHEYVVGFNWAVVCQAFTL